MKSEESCSGEKYKTKYCIKFEEINCLGQKKLVIKFNILYTGENQEPIYINSSKISIIYW